MGLFLMKIRVQVLSKVESTKCSHSNVKVIDKLQCGRFIKDKKESQNWHFFASNYVLKNNSGTLM